ncbi:MAG: DUF493 domain-containing protein [Acidiferrobacterales bacterium]|nr:DUF493 domain-containing protein [Acidiferrobacterales bacterium]
MTNKPLSDDNSQQEAMTFPCELDIKVFSKSEVNLQDKIHAMLQVNLPDAQILAVSGKSSSQGKYRSLSCKVIAESREQIDQVYRDLGKHPDVIMLL